MVPKCGHPHVLFLVHGWHLKTAVPDQGQCSQLLSGLPIWLCAPLATASKHEVGLGAAAEPDTDGSGSGSEAEAEAGSGEGSESSSFESETES